MTGESVRYSLRRSRNPPHCRPLAAALGVKRPSSSRAATEYSRGDRRPPSVQTATGPGADSGSRLLLLIRPCPTRGPKSAIFPGRRPWSCAAAGRGPSSAPSSRGTGSRGARAGRSLGGPSSSGTAAATLRWTTASRSAPGCAPTPSADRPGGPLHPPRRCRP